MNILYYFKYALTKCDKVHFWYIFCLLVFPPPPLFSYVWLFYLDVYTKFIQCPWSLEEVIRSRDCSYRQLWATILVLWIETFFARWWWYMLFFTAFGGGKDRQISVCLRPAWSKQQFLDSQGYLEKSSFKKQTIIWVLWTRRQYLSSRLIISSWLNARI